MSRITSDSPRLAAWQFNPVAASIDGDPASEVVFSGCVTSLFIFRRRFTFHGHKGIRCEIIDGKSFHV
jgi:hypothetical protein